MQTHLMSNKHRSEPTDDILIQQAHIGDQDAFEMLVNRYSALLLLLISRIVRDEHLAHDVLQHVFLQLYHSLPTLVSGDTLRAWLSQVARRRSIDELRRRRPILFSEIEPFPGGGNTHALPGSLTRISSQRSRSNCTSYDSGSLMRLRHYPYATARSCCSAILPN